MEIAKMIEKQQAFFLTGVTRDLAFRRTMLQKLRAAIISNEAAITAALQHDLNKDAFESYATEIGFIREEIKHALRHLSRWARPRPVPTPLAHVLSSSRIYAEPYGVVLILSPWNYPFQLAMAPLIGAIAAGNCAIVKPSDYARQTSIVIARIVSECFPADYITTVLGGRQANSSLLAERFDYIFFTGSEAVGRLVMESAARHLTPVTLELGGKSPCIVDETADIDLAARRIVWGKFLNAGQTCVAPDYLVVQTRVKAALLQSLAKYIHQFYGPSPAANASFPKIINEKHFARLARLMAANPVAIGGACNEQTRQIAPTVFDPVSWDSTLMQEEIFGPLLPLIEYTDLDSALTQIRERPKPLAFYYFSNDRKRQDQIIRQMPFGGGCINDTVVHLANPHLPFGGIGASGIGTYHGQASFSTFSRQKSILIKSNLLDIPVRYPPYTGKMKWLRLFMN